MRNQLFILCLFIVGCGDNDTPAPERSDQNDTGLSDAIQDNLDEASAVEDALMNKKNQLDRAVEDAMNQ